MTSTAHPAGTPALERLQRWQDAGGTWQVLHRSEHAVTVSLRRCDGGEEADRITSEDPALVAFLVGVDSSELA